MQETYELFLPPSNFATSSSLLFLSSGYMTILATLSGKHSTTLAVTQCLQSGATSVSPHPTFANIPFAQA
jgi:hypothetical protein